MQARQRNYRPSWALNVTNPVAGNYYPVNAAIRIEEGAGAQSSGTRALSVVNDRSQGGTSLASGQVELMVHRRMLADDGRGVGQALNESGLSGQGLIVRGRHWIMATHAATAARAAREQQQAVYFAPLAKLAPMQGLTPLQWADKFRTQRSGLVTALPDNVHLLTVDCANYGPGRALVRLAHLYAAGEDAALSKPATVALASLFADMRIKFATEQNLRGNQDVADAIPLLWKVAGEGSQPATRLQQWASMPPAGAELSVTLQPMDIRTFIVQFE
jgi:lysosomal alpha-mannosidase